MALYKQPNGIYHIRFTLNGKQIVRSAKTKNKSIAAQLEAQMRSDALKRALEGYTDRITVHAALDKYLAEKEHTASYTTIRSSVKALKEGIADKSLEKLNAHDIQQFVSSRIRNGIKETTITLNLSHLKIIINRMRALGYDVPDVKFPKAIRKNRLRFLSEDDADALLHQLMRVLPGEPPAITEYRHDVHDMVVFVLNTGARYSEVTNIQWQDVDLENRTLTLYRKKVDNYGTLPISDELYAVLRRRQRKSGYVFPGKRGERTYSMIPLRSAADAAGLNDPAVVKRTGCRVSWHVLRHTFASRMVQNGMSLQKLAVLLGHSDIKMTMVYAHLVPENVVTEALDILNARPRMRAVV